MNNVLTPESIPHWLVVSLVGLLAWIGKGALARLAFLERGAVRREELRDLRAELIRLNERVSKLEGQQCGCD